MNQCSQGPPQHFSWMAPSRLLWSMADVLPLRLQRRSALRKPACRRALQGHTDYIRGEKLWEENKCPGLCSGLFLSYLAFRRPEDGEDITVLFMKAAGFWGQYFWNLLCGLANRSSLLFRLVQKALTMPQETPEPAERVILVLAFCFSLCLQTKQHLLKWDLTTKTFAYCLPRLLVEEN